MRGIGRELVLFLALPLGACSLLGSVTDRSMEHAPFSSCTRFGDGMNPGPQCLVMAERRPDGGLRAFEGDTVRAGGELVATLSAAPQCQGNFTHATLAADAAGAGALRLAVPDALGRGDVGRDYRWEAGGPRRWTLNNVSRSVHVPGGLRIAVAQGEVRLTEICLKSYRRFRDRDPQARAAE